LIAAIAEISLTRLAAIANFVGALRLHFGSRIIRTMTNDTRLVIRLPARRRAALAEIAERAGLSSATLARLSLSWVVDHPGDVLPKLLTGGDRHAA
jgi:hypothetical protein